MYKIINQNKTNQRTSLLISLFETNYLKAEELFPKKLNTHFFSFSLPEGNLNNNVSCFDINQGCAGFVYALAVGGSMISNRISKKTFIYDHNAALCGILGALASKISVAAPC